MAAKKYWATRPFGYGTNPDGNTRNLDRGQVTELGGYRNDDKLLAYGYFEEFTGKAADLVECSECGERFLDHSMRIAHHEKRHVERDLTPEEEDRRADREEKMLETVAPLKTGG